MTVQLVFFQVPAGAWIRGVVIGMLTALLAIGLALVYRANRIVNFAQADLGFLPVSLVIGLVVFWGWPWGVGLIAGLLGAIVLGAVVEFAFVRRFRHTSRLVLTVATIGITQLLAVGALLMPRWWGQRPTSQRIPAPFDTTVTIGTFVLGANDLIALVAAPLAMAAVAFFLDRTRVGIAIRATAERSDRAAMLGIPVSRLATLTWVVASLLSFVALFLRAGILGVPWGTAIGATALVPAIAASAIGQLATSRRSRSPRSRSACSSTASRGTRRARSSSRRSSAPRCSSRCSPGTSRWGGPTCRRRRRGGSPRRSGRSPCPGRRCRRWSAIRLASWIVLVGCALALPAVLRVDQVIKATPSSPSRWSCVSLVVLTGWAGQISLGQVAFFAIGAATSASRHEPLACRSDARRCWSAGSPVRSRRSQSGCLRCASRACTSPSRRSSSPSP